MTARLREDAGALLGRALTLFAREHGRTLVLGAVRTQPWASATFEGERVVIDVSYPVADAAWLADLVEAELHVRGYLVADLAVDDTADDAVSIEALLIRAA